MDILIAALAVSSLALAQNLYSIYKKNDTPNEDVE